MLTMVDNGAISADGRLTCGAIQLYYFIFVFCTAYCFCNHRWGTGFELAYGLKEMNFCISKSFVSVSAKLTEISVTLHATCYSCVGTTAVSHSFNKRYSQNLNRLTKIMWQGYF